MGTRMTQIKRIYTDMCVFRSNVKPVGAMQAYGYSHTWQDFGNDERRFRTIFVNISVNT